MMGISSGTFKTFYFIIGILAAIAALYVNIIYVFAIIFGIFLIQFTFNRFDLSFLAFLLFVPIIPNSHWNNIYLFLGSAFYFCVSILKFNILDKNRPDFKKCGASFLIFMLAAVCGVVFSHDRSDSLRIFLFFLSSFFIFFTLMNFIKNEKTLNRVVMVLFLGVILTSVYAIYQNIVGVAVDPALVDVTVNAGMPGRAFGTFGNPNNFAEYLILLMPFCFSYAITRKSQAGRIVWLLLFILPVLALVFTLSRSSWIGFAIAAFVFMSLINWKVIPAVLLVVAVSLPLWPDYVVHRILTIGNMQDTSNSVRIYIWRDSLEMMKHYWTTGIGLGPNSFHMIYPIYAKYFALAPHSHLLYLEMLVETGILGAVSFLAILWRTVKKAYLKLRETCSDTVKYTLIASIASISGISFVGLVEYIFFYPRVMFIYFAVLGITLSTVFLEKQDKPKIKPAIENETSAVRRSIINANGECL